MKSRFSIRVKLVSNTILITMMLSCLPNSALGYSINLQKTEYQTRTKATEQKIKKAHEKADNVLKKLTKPINDRITPQTNKDLVFAYGVLEGIPKTLVDAYKSGYSALTWSNPLNLRAGIMTSYYENPETYKYMATHLPQTGIVIVNSLSQDGIHFLDSITSKDNYRGSGNFFGEVLTLGGILKAASSVTKGVSTAVQAADKASKAANTPMKASSIVSATSKTKDVLKPVSSNSVIPVKSGNSGLGGLVSSVKNLGSLLPDFSAPGNGGATIIGSRAIPTTVAAGMRTVYSAPKIPSGLVRTASKGSGGMLAKGQSLQGDLKIATTTDMVKQITPIEILYSKGKYLTGEGKVVTGKYIGVIRENGEIAFAPFEIFTKTITQYTTINRKGELLPLHTKVNINGKSKITYTPKEFSFTEAIKHTQLARINGPKYPVSAAFNAVFQNGKLLKWNEITAAYEHGNSKVGLIQKALPTATQKNWRAFEFYDEFTERAEISKMLKELNLKRDKNLPKVNVEKEASVWKIRYKEYMEWLDFITRLSQ